MWQSIALLRVVLLAASALLEGCSAFGTRLQDSARLAARDPWTWVPLAGATVIAAADGDQRLSDWAKERNPVYGSRAAALDASDRFRNYASTSAWALFAVAPPKNSGSWANEKAMDGGGTLIGLAMARNATGLLKPAVGRERPHNGPVHDSFPSAHASDAFAHASVARYYTDDLRPLGVAHRGLDLLTGAFAAATAWGRVEGGVHYPTDVLVAAGLANFTTRLVLEFNAPDEKSGWRVRPIITPDRDLLVGFGKGL